MSFSDKLLRLATLSALALLGAGGVFVGYTLIRADLTADVYRRRLAEAAGAYEQLRERYNQAVARTAVTELVVTDTAVSVRVRTDAGLIKDIPTPINPRDEVYVDYVVVDSRLWIRRVFSARTAPDQAVVIDPAMGAIDWNDPRVTQGKAVYRRLTPGRWLISVSGDGALTLAPTNTPADLTHAPTLRDFDTLAEDARKDADALGPADVWRWLRSPGP
jgi:hypothetical protein